MLTIRLRRRKRKRKKTRRNRFFGVCKVKVKKHKKVNSDLVKVRLENIKRADKWSSFGYKVFLGLIGTLLVPLILPFLYYFLNKECIWHYTLLLIVTWLVIVLGILAFRNVVNKINKGIRMAYRLLEAYTLSRYTDYVDDDYIFREYYEKELSLFGKWNKIFAKWDIKKEHIFCMYYMKKDYLEKLPSVNDLVEEANKTKKQKLKVIVKKSKEEKKAKKKKAKKKRG